MPFQRATPPSQREQTPLTSPEQTGSISTIPRSSSGQILSPDQLLSDPVLYHQLLVRSAPHLFAEWASDGKWKAYPYLAYLGRQIAMEMAKATAAGTGARIIINLPPRHGKSWLISKWVPIWFLENNPDKNVIMTSYGSELAEKFGREVRDEFQNNPHLTVKLREDVKSVSTWLTTQGGGMKSAGIGTGITGFGYHLGIIDDPVKDWQMSISPLEQAAFRDWFDSTFFTRKEPGAHIILLMHRWNAKDPAGYLINEHTDPWHVIRIPAMAEENDPVGRQPGEALCEERVTLRDLLSAKSANDVVFNSMYQQNPPNEDGDRVYDHYTEAENTDKTIVPFTHDATGAPAPLRLTLDFNVNPGMHAEIWQYDSRLDMSYWYQEIHGWRMKTEAVMDEFEKWVKGQGGWKWEALYIHGDRSGKTETTQTATTDYQLIQNKIDLMNKNNGWNIVVKMRVPNQNPPVKNRVDTVNEALRDADGVHVKVHPLNCPRLKEDLGKQIKDEDGMPDKSDKLMGHAGDAMGYGLVWVRPVRRMKFTPQRVQT